MSVNCSRLDAIAPELERLMARWVELEALSK